MILIETLLIHHKFGSSGCESSTEFSCTSSSQCIQMSDRDSPSVICKGRKTNRSLPVEGGRAEPKNAKILKEQRFNAGDGRFGSAFAQEDGTVYREETTADGERIGQYSYIDNDGKTITVRYTAGKDGFRILEGAHVPTGATGLEAAAFAAQWRVPQQQDKSSFHSPTSRLSQLCSVQEEGDEQEHTMQIFPEMILETPLDSPAGAQFSRASRSSFGFTPRADAVPFTPTSEVSGLNSAQRSQSACFNFQQVSDRASLAQMELFEPPVPFAPPALDRSQSQPDLGSNRRASKSEVRRSLKKIIRSQVKQQMKEEKQQQKLRNSLSSFDFSPVKREKPEKKLRCSMSAVSSSGSERRSPEETLEFFRHLQQLQAMQNSGYTSEVVSRESSFSGSQLAITA